MRLGWRKPYELRGSRTVLREAGVELPGRLTSPFFYQTLLYKIADILLLLALLAADFYFYKKRPFKKKAKYKGSLLHLHFAE